MNLKRLNRFGVAAVVACLFTTMAHAQDRIVVSAQPLSELLIEQRQFAPASVVAANQSIIAAQLSAQILDIYADVGEVIKKGQPLATLDPKDYALALEQAEASLASMDAQIKQAQARLNRALQLSDSQYLSADDLLARETDVAVATANRVTQQVAIRTAKHNLTKTRIKAPFDAVVVSRTAQQGSYATPGAPMFELAQLDGRELEARVATDLIASVQSARSLRYERNGQTWPVDVLRVSPLVESSSGIQIVRLAFTESPALIGSSGQLSWISGDAMLSADMLVKRSTALGVFVVENDTARFIEVVGAQEGRPAVVSLPLDALVVTNGRFKLQNGNSVSVARN